MTKVVLKFPEFHPVFFVGASAGGVSALTSLASQLPEDFPSPLFFMLHRIRSSSTPDRMKQILSANSKLKVVVPSHGDLIKAGTIYLPPEDQHMGVEDNRIVFSSMPDDEMWRPAIDVLFKSAAREYKDRAVCVLLTGKLDDGVEGLRETTFQGGITVAQSPDDAYAPYLPLNALLNDHPVYVLPLEDMPSLFCELASHPYSKDQRNIAIRAAECARELKEKLS